MGSFVNIKNRIKTQEVERITKSMNNKTGFLITLSGPTNSTFYQRLLSVINGANARTYSLPDNQDQLSKTTSKLRKENLDSFRVLDSTLENLRMSAKSLVIVREERAANRYLTLKARLSYVQMILDELNKCKRESNFLVGHFWIPETRLDYLGDALNMLKSRPEFQGFTISEESPKELDLHPPTRFQKNIFLSPFQEIVNTYGIPRYREINPAIFTSITFPFLFGLMYGDIGHGTFLFLFGLFLFLYSKSLSSQMRIEFFDVRSYSITILLMGFFSVYAGIIYNDFLALPVTIFPSCYKEIGNSFGKFLLIYITYNIFLFKRYFF